MRALEARRVPHVLVGGRSFHEREEVLALRNALAAIEWPDDELSVYATLRGPFFALGDDALLAFRHAQHGALAIRCGALEDSDAQPAHAPTSPRRSPSSAALHRGRNRRPIADTIARLLEATRAHAGVAIWPTGEQALANILRVLDLARRFEAAGATSFRAFVTRLEDDAERGGAAEAPVVEEGTDGVRIMTVHKAKGLEFPVVILVDPTAPRPREQPSRYVDPTRRLWAMPLAGCAPIELLEQRDEVLRARCRRGGAPRLRRRDARARAARRAGGRRRDWPTMRRPRVARRAPPRDLPQGGRIAECRAGAGVSAVRRRQRARATRERAPRSRERGASGVSSPRRSGKHRSCGGIRRRSSSTVKTRSGCANSASWPPTTGAAAANEGERLHAEWQSRRAGAARCAARCPRSPVSTVTELTRASRNRFQIGGRSTSPPSRHVPGVRTESGSACWYTRSWRRSISWPIPSKSLKSRRAEGRLVSASVEEIDAAAAGGGLALRHSLIARAARASTCRRESPVLLALGDGSLVEGVLDMAFREMEDDGAVWTVVDFKTDVEIAGRKADYERQIDLYVRAVATATGEPRARRPLIGVIPCPSSPKSNSRAVV